MIPHLHGNRLLEFHTPLSLLPPLSFHFSSTPPPSEGWSVDAIHASGATANGKPGLWARCSALLVSSGRCNDGVRRLRPEVTHVEKLAG